MNYITPAFLRESSSIKKKKYNKKKTKKLKRVKRKKPSTRK